MYILFIWIGFSAFGVRSEKISDDRNKSLPSRHIYSLVAAGALCSQEIYGVRWVSLDQTGFTGSHKIQWV